MAPDQTRAIRFYQDPIRKDSTARFGAGILREDITDHTEETARWTARTAPYRWPRGRGLGAAPGPVSSSCYLYHPIGHHGKLPDSLLGERRDMDAVRRFFALAIEVVRYNPSR